jgi:hypothetical protein
MLRRVYLLHAEPTTNESLYAHDHLQLMKLSTVLLGTLVSHTLLTAGVFVHGRRTDRDPGYWLPATFCFGLLGVAGYLFSD